MGIDNILGQVGEFGLYQKLLCGLFVFYTTFLCGLNYYTQVSHNWRDVLMINWGLTSYELTTYKWGFFRRNNKVLVLNDEE